MNFVFQWHSSLPYDPKYLDRQAWANSVDPDQTLQNVASNKGLQFSFNNHILVSHGGQMELFKIF